MFAVTSLNNEKVSSSCKVLYYCKVILTYQGDLDLKLLLGHRS